MHPLLRPQKFHHHATPERFLPRSPERASESSPLKTSARRLLHPVFTSPPAKIEAFELPQVVTSEKGNRDETIMNIGQVAPREDKLPKVAVCKNPPFRVKRALLYQLSYQPTTSAAAFNPAGKLIPRRSDAGQIKSGANTNSHARPAQEFFPPNLVINAGTPATAQ